MAHSTTIHLATKSKGTLSGNIVNIRFMRARTLQRDLLGGAVTSLPLRASPQHDELARARGRRSECSSSSSVGLEATNRVSETRFSSFSLSRKARSAEGSSQSHGAHVISVEEREHRRFWFSTLRPLATRRQNAKSGKEHFWIIVNRVFFFVFPQSSVLYL